MFTTIATWFSSAKLVIIIAALAMAAVALLIWKSFAKGRAAALADTAIASMDRAIEASIDKLEQERKNAKQRAKDRSTDPNNRDNWM